MTQTEALQVLAGLVGSMGFAILFHIRGKRLFAASLGGMLSWLLFLLFNRWVQNEAVAYFLVAAAISVYAEVLAKILKSPVTTFNIISLIPMIPGGSLYYTMVSAFQKESAEFLPRALHTLQLATALALGIVVVTTMARVIQKIIHGKR